MSKQPPKTVLMVDDSDEDAALVAAAIQEGTVACQLRAVTSADAAVAYLRGKTPYADRKLHPLPSLIFLDIQMPRKDGFSVLEWVRAQRYGWRRVPILMLTTSHDYAEIRRAFDLGANSYLVKPTGFDELCRMMNDTLAYWLGHHRVAPDEPVKNA